MSDAPKDDTWWKGVDGLWYPPVARVEPSGESESLEIAPGSMKASRKWKGLIVAIAVVLIGVIAVWLVRDRKPSTGMVLGTFSLIEKSSGFGGWSMDRDCNTSGGYSDIGSSTQVVVKNKFGEELGRTELGSLPMFSDDSGRKCTWTFMLEVPRGEEYYILSVGRRGEMKYTFEEITSVVSLTLGDD